MKLNDGENFIQGKARSISKDCAYIAVFVALTIAAQLCFSAIPGVELVTILFVSFSFAFGSRRGMLAATVFSLLRQLVFGFFLSVLVLYLLYYNMLAWLFGFLGKRMSCKSKNLPLLTGIACVCTVGFTMLDNVITSLWLGYSGRMFKLYFMASLSFMVPQVICTAVTVSILFLPLVKIFRKI